MSRTRIGAVSFLNARPLVYGLQTGTPDCVLSFDVPSALAEKLRLGEIDVGLIPVVEHLRGVGESFVPGIGIASDGPVRTVKLWSRVPLESLKNVAVDSRSRTSVALLRILLAERYGVMPDFYSFRGQLPEMLQTHEAALLIGDGAFTEFDAAHVWDLGQGWKDLTGLPCVYAVWTVRQGVDSERVAVWLQRAMTAGVAHLDDIAREATGTCGLDQGTILCYLRDNLHFALGERDRQGIEAFQRYCVRYNLVPANRSLGAGAPVHP